jgi:hypothetical protein
MGKYKIEFKWSFIFIGALIAWSFLEKIIGFHDKYIDLHATFAMFFMIPAIWIYVLAMKSKKNTFYPGKMSYLQGFVTGLTITIIVTLFTPITQWLISYVVAPDYFENIIAYSVELGYDSVEEARAYFNYQNYAMQSSLWTFIMGLMTSSIVAFFVRSKSK